MPGPNGRRNLCADTVLAMMPAIMMNGARAEHDVGTENSQWRETAGEERVRWLVGRGDVAGG